MIYIDIILTDTEDAIEISGKHDHKWIGLKDKVKKPKVSLWDLYRLKKFIETGYERLKEQEDNQSDSECDGEELEVGGGDVVDSVAKS